MIKHVNQIYYVSALNSTVLSIRGVQEGSRTSSVDSVSKLAPLQVQDIQDLTQTRATSVESQAAQGRNELLVGQNVKTTAHNKSEDRQPNVEGSWVDVVRTPPKTNTTTVATKSSISARTTSTSQQIKDVLREAAERAYQIVKDEERKAEDATIWCKFYPKGKCKKGNDCPFRHPDDENTGRVRPSPDSAATKLGRVAKPGCERCWSCHTQEALRRVSPWREAGWPWLLSLCWGHAPDAMAIAARRSRPRRSRG